MPRTPRKPPSIKGFVLDEQLQRAAVDALAALGWPAGQPGYASGLDVPDKGTSDPELLNWAVRHRCCFVTRDYGFVPAGAVPSQHWGVVILVCEPHEEADLISRIAARARRPELGSVLQNFRFLVSPDRVVRIEPDGSFSQPLEW